jgi:hypothetical protein
MNKYRDWPSFMKNNSIYYFAIGFKLLAGRLLKKLRISVLSKPTTFYVTHKLLVINTRTQQHRSYIICIKIKNNQYSRCFILLSFVRYCYYTLSQNLCHQIICE